MPRLNNPRQEAVAQMKAQGYINPEKALSDVQIVKKAYGYSKESAEAHASVVVASSGVQTRLQELLEHHIPDQFLAKKSKQLLNCKKVIITKAGKQFKVPDNTNQLATVALVMKAKGHLKNDGDRIIDNRSVQFNLQGNQQNSHNNQPSKLDLVFERLQHISSMMLSDVPNERNVV